MVPVVSVMPYICTKPHLNTSMHSFSSAAGIGEAPYSMYFSFEKSTSRARGCRTTNFSAAGPYQTKKIRMRQHRAFRLSGCARSVELDRDVLVVDRHLRIVAALRVAPGGKIQPVRGAAFGRHEGTHARQLRLDAADLLD